MSANGFTFDMAKIDALDIGGQKLKIATAPNKISFIVSEITSDVQSIHHYHADFECIYILEGSVISNGETFVAGQGFIAEKDSEHYEFRTNDYAKFIVVNYLP